MMTRPVLSFRLISLTVLALAGASVLHAADNVRVDLRGKGVDLDVAITEGKGSVRDYTWNGEEQKKQSRWLSFAIPPSKWTKLTFTVTVATATEVSLMLRGPDRRAADGTTKIPVLVQYDQIEVTGAPVKNGGFETLDANGQPQSWWKGKDDLSLAKLVTSGAQEGTNAVATWHDGAYSQKLALPATTPVTVSIFAFSEVDPAAK